MIEKPSAHFEPRTVKPDMIVIHATATNTLEETFRYLIYSKAPNRVSAHYVIDRDGTVYKLVDEEMAAWHAGLSEWQGHKNVNNRSIGVEFQCPKVGENELGDFTDEQIGAGILLCSAIMERWGIALSNVVRHSDIAPNRKVDPGQHFPWQAFKEALTFFVSDTVAGEKD